MVANWSAFPIWTTGVRSSMPVTAPLRHSTARHEGTCVSTKEASRRTRVDSALHFFSNRMNSSTEEIMVGSRIFLLGIRSQLKLPIFVSTVAGNQGIDFLQQRLIALPGIACQFFTKVGQVVEKRLDAFFVQLFPIGAVSHLVQPVSVEDLLELMADGHGQIWLAQMQRLG